MDEKRVKEWALEWIGRNLDPDRWCYHQLWHVRRVVEDVTEFGCAAGVSAEELSLLRSAAWLHDAGYATDPKHHEEASARIALEILPGLGVSAGDADTIAALILATDPSRNLESPLEKLIRDADIGQVGSSRFFEAVELLRRELAQNGKHFTDLEFWRFERDFLCNINFRTEAARKLRGPGLERNRSLVAARLAELEGNSRA